MQKNVYAYAENGCIIFEETIEYVDPTTLEKTNKIISRCVNESIIGSFMIEER